MNWQRKLDQGGVVLVDGGMGSELKRRSVAMDAAAWSGLAVLGRPDMVRAIHADYIDAGADVVIANTFGASRFLLDAAGVGDAFETVNRRAVALAAEARTAVGKSPDEVAIAGSISNLPPNMDVGRYPPPAAESAAPREQVAILADAGVDLIALEMMRDTELRPERLRRRSPLTCRCGSALAPGSPPAAV